MNSYVVEITTSAQKQLQKLSSNIAEKLELALLDLEKNPRPFGYIKLRDREVYRIRVGNYRIIYKIEDDILVITVIYVSHRKDAY